MIPKLNFTEEEEFKALPKDKQEKVLNYYFEKNIADVEYSLLPDDKKKKVLHYYLETQGIENPEILPTGYEKSFGDYASDVWGKAKETGGKIIDYFGDDEEEPPVEEPSEIQKPSPPNILEQQMLVPPASPSGIEDFNATQEDERKAALPLTTGRRQEEISTLGPRHEISTLDEEEKEGWQSKAYRGIGEVQENLLKGATIGFSEKVGELGQMASDAVVEAITSKKPVAEKEKPVLPGWAGATAELAGEFAPIGATYKVVGKPVVELISKSKHLKPFAEMIGWGASGSSFHVAKTLAEEGELPTPKEIAQEGGIWAAIEGVMQAGGWTGKFAIGIERLAKAWGVPRKEALKTVIEQAKKENMPIAQYAYDKGKVQKALRKAEDKTKLEESLGAMEERMPSGEVSKSKMPQVPEEVHESAKELVDVIDEMHSVTESGEYKLLKDKLKREEVETRKKALKAYTEKVFSISERKALPEGQGFELRGEKEKVLSEYAPEEAARIGKLSERRALPEGQGFELRKGTSEEILSKYSPEEAARLKAEAEKKALPEGQGFDLKQKTRFRELPSGYGEPTYVEGKYVAGKEAPESLAVEYKPILSAKGTPFKSEASAKLALKSKKGISEKTHEIAPVKGGFGIAKKTEKPAIAREADIPEFNSGPEAQDFGKIATPKQIEAIKKIRDERYARAEELRKEGKENEAFMEAQYAGFYREAVEASEGTIKPPKIPKAKEPSGAEKQLIEKKERWKKFDELASNQRGKPEEAMRAVQKEQISQMYGHELEHVGDLTHRMAQKPEFFKGDFVDVNKKVNSALRYLKDEYGFEREVLEQVRDNLKYYQSKGKLAGKTKEQQIEKLKTLGQKYANEHKKLEVYNEAQENARDAAIALGEWRFKDAINHLENLKKHLDKGEEHWAKYALEIRKPSGAKSKGTKPPKQEKIKKDVSTKAKSGPEQNALGETVSVPKYKVVDKQKDKLKKPGDKGGVTLGFGPSEVLQRTYEQLTKLFTGKDKLKKGVSSAKPILTSGGNPFKDKKTAELAMKTTRLKDMGVSKDTHEVVSVDGGFGIASKGAKETISGVEPVKNTPVVDTVLKKLKASEIKNREQLKIYKKERSKRKAKALGKGEGLEGREKFYKEKGQLKGKMKRVSFEPLEEKLSEKEITEVFNQIDDCPLLSFYDSIAAREGFQLMLEGKVPTKSQLNFMRTALGPELVQQLELMSPLLHKAGHLLLDVANVPRAVMASADFSAPLRQGVFLIGTKSWWKALPSNFKYWFSKGAFEAGEKVIREKPTYKAMVESNLFIADMGTGLAAREEKFMSNIAGKLPLVTRSNRAYIGFLNKLRADVFDSFVRDAEKIGIGTPDQIARYLSNPKKYLDTEIHKYFVDASRFINRATGRGGLWKAEKAAVILNSTFFSPRLTMSRLQLLNPVMYLNPKTNKHVRRKALESLLSFAGIALTTAGLIKYGFEKAWGKEVNVGTDPRNADFMKLKSGNLRYDILAGFQQPIRMAAQFITKEVVSSTTGKVITLGEGYKPLKRSDIIIRFLEYKEAPIVTFVTGALLTGTNSLGQPFDYPTEIMNRMVPMAVQDLQELYNQKGKAGIPLAMPAFVGTGAQYYGGVQSYGLREKDYPKLNKELNDIGIAMGWPNTTAYGMELSVKEYKEFKEVSGKQIAKTLNKLIVSDTYKSLNKAQKKKWIEDTIDAEKEYVKERMFVGKKRLSEYSKYLMEYGGIDKPESIERAKKALGMK
jgi:hypothetical protein